MGKHAQLVIGPAGSGKSTFCDIMQKHCEASKRAMHVVNLDPAADEFKYKASIDIRDLISLEDVMSELDLGPNGGLVYCMEYLIENLTWFSDAVADYHDDYLVIDCPGQIELYSHLPVMRSIARMLQQSGYTVAAVYCIDSLVMTDAARLISGTLMCLSAMVQLELPHVNVMTKCDLLQNKKELDNYIDPDVPTLVAKLNAETTGTHRKLNHAVGKLIEDYSMVSFLPLDVTSEDSIELVLSTIDHAIQYGEDLEPKEPRDENDREPPEPEAEPHDSKS